MIHIVAYDLKQPNDTEANYELIIDALKSQFDSWCHIEQSVWIVDTKDDAGAIRDTLKNYVHEGDVLFVARLTGNWGSWNFGGKRNEWLKSRTF